MLYTLFFVISIGGHFSSNPISISTAVIPGFTSEQACKNAGRELYKQNYHNREMREARVTINCVSMSV